MVIVVMFQVVSHNRSRDNADLTKSSPLAVLVEQDGNNKTLFLVAEKRHF